MKYNDKSSTQFQQRSFDRDPYDDYLRGNRKEQRKKQRQFEYEIRTQLKHPLCAVMTNKQKVDLYQEYKWGTGNRFNNMYQNHVNFDGGSFTDFIEYLKVEGDERMTKLVIKLRDRNIHKIIG